MQEGLVMSAVFLVSLLALQKAHNKTLKSDNLVYPGSGSQAALDSVFRGTRSRIRNKIKALT